MKLGAIVSQQFIASFTKLMDSTDLPVKTRFKLRGINKILKDKQEDFESLNNQIITKYAKKDESGKVIFVDGDRVTFNPEDMPALNKDSLELRNVEVEIPSVSCEELGSVIECLSSKDISLLEFIVE
jgi:hypothetical protein